MKEKSRYEEIANIDIPPHAVNGGYIYIPNEYIKILPQKPFTAHFQYEGKELNLIVSLDSNGRLRKDKSSKENSSLRSWIHKNKIKPTHRISVNRQSKTKDPHWLFIITPKKKVSDSKENLLVPNFADQLTEMYSFAQNIGTSNMLKAFAIFNDINNLIDVTYKEVLDPTFLIKFSVKDCIDEIQQDIRLHAFFDKFWENDAVRNLFSCRAEDFLPPVIEENADDDENQLDSSSKLLLYIPVVEPFTDEDINAVKSIHSRILLELTHRYQSLVHLARELFSYIGDQLDEIEKFEDELDKDEMRRIIGEILELVQKELGNKKMKNDIKKLIKDSIQDWGWLLPRVIWFLIEKQIRIIDLWMSDLSYRCRLDSTTIYNAFDSLIDNEVLRPLAQINWCNNHPEKPQYTLSTGITLKSKTICGICHDEMKYITITSIHPNILKYLKHRDGLPLIASAWLAQKKGLKWNANYYNGKDVEIDLWISDRKKQKSVVFEFWMTEVSQDSLSFKRRLRDKKRELIRDIEKLKGAIDDIPIEEKYIVTNTSKSNLSRHPKQERKNDEVQVISIDEIVSVMDRY